MPRWQEPHKMHAAVRPASRRPARKGGVGAAGEVRGCTGVLESDTKENAAAGFCVGGPGPSWGRFNSFWCCPQRRKRCPLLTVHRGTARPHALFRVAVRQHVACRTQSHITPHRHTAARALRPLPRIPALPHVPCSSYRPPTTYRQPHTAQRIRTCCPGQRRAAYQLVTSRDRSADL